MYFKILLQTSWVQDLLPNYRYSSWSQKVCDFVLWYYLNASYNHGPDILYVAKYKYYLRQLLPHSFPVFFVMLVSEACYSDVFIFYTIFFLVFFCGEFQLSLDQQMKNNEKKLDNALCQNHNLLHTERRRRWETLNQYFPAGNVF